MHMLTEIKIMKCRVTRPGKLQDLTARWYGEICRTRKTEDRLQTADIGTWLRHTRDQPADHHTCKGHLQTKIIEYDDNWWPGSRDISHSVEAPWLAFWPSFGSGSDPVWCKWWPDSTTIICYKIIRRVKTDPWWQKTQKMEIFVKSKLNLLTTRNKNYEGRETSDFS